MCVKGGFIMNNIQNYQENIFETIKHIDEYGNEYWLARDLMQVLKYVEWRKFSNAIKRAMLSCENSNSVVEDHFVVVDKMVQIGSGAKRKQEDYRLSRYACYLIVQNGDSRKQEVALGQTYFAIQTRKMELIEYENMNENQKRLYRRNEIKKKNLSLNQTAKKAGVKNFDKFTNAGYKGLYNGETANDIAKRKGLRYREDILDNMCSDELIANEFRISLTNQKLKQDNIKGENNANKTHYDMGTLVRKTIEEAKTTLPENFETPKKSIKELNKDELKVIKGGCANLYLNLFHIKSNKLNQKRLAYCFFQS